MALALFLLALPAGGQGLRINGCDAVLVAANDAPGALAAAQAAFPQAASTWGSAVVVGATDWLNWTFKVRISGGAKLGAEHVEVQVVGSDVNKSVDAINAQLVTLLNANKQVPITGAAYDATTNVLTAAALADGLGDATLTVTVSNPQGVAVAGLVSSIVDAGVAAAVLTATMPADAALAPGVVGMFKQV